MMLAVLQARMSSTRFPGKVLEPILGEPMLFRQIERVRRCEAIDDLVVATSIDPSDDRLAQACTERNIAVARGSLADVLERFVTAARPYRPDAVVRLTGDCPLADPAVLGAVVACFQDGAYDYASNVEPATFPDGLDVEIMRISALEQAHRDARLPSHREHVTPYLRSHPDLFRRGNVENPVDLSHLRWTVDEPADLAFVQKIYARLYPGNPRFDTRDVLDLLEREPALSAINAGFERNAGMIKSAAADAEFLRQPPE